MLFKLKRAILSNLLPFTYMIRNDFFLGFNSLIYAKYLFRKAGINARIKAGVIIDSPADMTIGDNFNLGEYSFVAAQGGITCGDNVIIGHHVSILSATHPIGSIEGPIAMQSLKLAAVIIEDDVWIGSGARVLPGIHIGKGAVIGANAVVTKNVPSYAVAAGIPASVLRIRKKNTD